MNAYFQTCAAVMLALILILMLKDGRELGTLLSLGVCCMASIAAMSYLRPVLEFLGTLEALCNLNGDMLGILIKAVGIGLLTEIAGLVCSDAGNASLGKTVQFLGTAVILWLSLPLFQSLMELLQSILGEL